MRKESGHVELVTVYTLVLHRSSNHFQSSFSFILHKQANDITTCLVSYPDLLEGADQTRGKGLANLGRMYTLVYRVGGVLYRTV